MSKILKGTTKVDYESSTVKTNEEIGGEYSRQLYRFLRNDINEEESKRSRVFTPRSVRNENVDRIIINAYERSMKKLGLDPNTEEIRKAAKHDDNAVFFRVCGPKYSLYKFFHKEFKQITHVIENKRDYMNLEVGNGIVTGISTKCICITDKEGHKEFFWYISPPLRYENANAKGLEVVKYLINNYGE